jgi:GxxExxY protein
MHPLYEKASSLTGEIIAAAIEVHKTMGPGLIESIYEWCLMKELELRGFHVSNQAIVTVRYKTFCRDEPLRYDVLVEQCVLVEVKAIEDVHPIHKAKLLSYMKLMDVPIGLLINFHVEKLVDGVSRLMLPGSAS